MIRKTRSRTDFHKTQEILFKACAKSDVSTVNRLLSDRKKINLNLNFLDGATGQSPLHVAVQNGNMALVKLLIENGCDPNTFNSDQATPLHLACIVGRSDLVNFLAVNGADVHIRSRYESTALHWAAREGYLSIVKYLHKRGLSFDDEDVFGSKPVFWAAQGGHIDMMEYMAREGQNFRLLNRKGLGPLHIACRRGHLHAVTYLLKTGVDVETGSDPPSYFEGDSAFVLVSGRWELGRIEEIKPDHYILSLKASGRIVESPESDVTKVVSVRPLHLATQQLRGKVVKTLLDHGANLHARDHHSKTPLHYASKAGTVAVLSELLRAGASLEDTDTFGQTPLFVACRHGEVGAAEVLLLHGAKIPSEGINNGEWVRFKKSVPPERQTLIKDLIWNAGPGGKNLAGKLRQMEKKIISLSEQGSLISSPTINILKSKSSKSSLFRTHRKAASPESKDSDYSFDERIWPPSIHDNQSTYTSVNVHDTNFVNSSEAPLSRKTLHRNQSKQSQNGVAREYREESECGLTFKRMLCMMPPKI